MLRHNKYHPPSEAPVVHGSRKLLLGQLVAYGDCLYATTIARQIKHDYPDCHLTWAIGSMCRSILDGNPYVDAVWEIPISRIPDVNVVWAKFAREAKERKKQGEFDEIFLTQVVPGNLQNYDGTIRSSIFNAYPGPITVPITPVLRLSPAEVENVRRFADCHALTGRSRTVLFESSPKSGQSCITHDLALDIAQRLVARIPDVQIILSSNISFHSPEERIIDGSALSLRENAELTKYCSLLVGGSSGVSWIATADWSLPLPTIQLLRADAIWFASLIHDHEYWGLPTDSILEMYECPVEKVVDCVATALIDGFTAARTNYHERIPLPFSAYHMIMAQLLFRVRLIKAFQLLAVNIRRHGWRSELFLLPLPRLFRTNIRAFFKKVPR